MHVSSVPWLKVKKIHLYFFPTDSFSQGEPRVLGLAMIPGHHVVSIEVESESLQTTTHGL